MKPAPDFNKWVILHPSTLKPNMEYRKIVSVTGLPGLFEIISSKTDGAIVRSLDDKATKFVASRTHNLSHLESIEVYTVTDNVNLSEIFFAMDKVGAKLPEGKDAKAVKQFFEKVFPDLDFGRVYNSDMKKMVCWYSILKTHGIEVKLTEEPVEEESETIEPVAEVKEEVKSVKKAKAKNTEEPKEEKITEKPAEKPKAKKTSEKAGDKPAAEKEAPKKAAKKK
jgi:hypothetical protein